jgi:hypothetical protein
MDSFFNCSTKCVQDNNEDFFIRETSMLLTVLDIQVSKIGLLWDIKYLQILQL